MAGLLYWAMGVKSPAAANVVNGSGASLAINWPLHWLLARRAAAEPFAPASPWCKLR
jgi:hypothetical protein